MQYELALHVGERLTLEELANELASWKRYGKPNDGRRVRRRAGVRKRVLDRRSSAPPTRSTRSPTARASSRNSRASSSPDSRTPATSSSIRSWGGGTTLLEAALLGRATLGNDVNPLSRLLVEARLDPPSPAEVEARLHTLSLDGPAERPDDFDVFFHERTLNQICRLRDYLIERRAAGAADAVDRWIQMVALNRLTGHSRGFFSVYTLPPNQAASIERQRKNNAQRNQAPEYRDVAALILRKTRRLLRDLPRQAPTGRSRGFPAAGRSPSPSPGTGRPSPWPSRLRRS